MAKATMKLGALLFISKLCLFWTEPALALRFAYTTRTIVEAYKADTDNRYNQAYWGGVTIHFRNMSNLVQNVEIAISGERMFNYLWLQFPPGGMGGGWDVDHLLWFSKSTPLTRIPATFNLVLAPNAELDHYIGVHCIWNKAGPACQPAPPPNGACIGDIPFTGDVDQRGNWSFVMGFKVTQDRGAILGSYTTVAGLCGNRNVVQNGASFQINGGRPF